MLLFGNIIRRNVLSLGNTASLSDGALFFRTGKSRNLTTGKHFSAVNASTGSSSVNENEVKKFQSYSKMWWSDGLKPLRELNRTRVPVITDGILSTCSPKHRNSSKPLQGVTILDIGCGGGILAEPLARLGAHVTGIDPVTESIEVARNHADLDPEIRDNLQYICGTVEDLCKEHKKYDAVVCSEVFEHVDNAPHFVRSCISLARHNGYVYFSSINRTIFSYLYFVLLGEYVMGFIPRGAFEWRRFMKLQELKILLETHNCRILKRNGAFYDPVSKTWFNVPYTGAVYSFCAVRESVIAENTHEH